MATVNSSTATNVATFVKDTIYDIKITGFTYMGDWAVIKGKERSSDTSVSVIIGDKLSFGMRDMFELKHAKGIRAKFREIKTIKGVDYPSFRLEEIILPSMED